VHSNLCILVPSQIAIPCNPLWSFFLILLFAVVHMLWSVITIIMVRYYILRGTCFLCSMSTLILLNFLAKHNLISSSRRKFVNGGLRKILRTQFVGVLIICVLFRTKFCVSRRSQHILNVTALFIFLDQASCKSHEEMRRINVSDCRYCRRQPWWR